MPGRHERVAEAIRQEIATLVLFEMRDPRLAGVTITGAKVSRDLTHARVFVSVLGDEAELARAVEALSDAEGFVRSKLAPRLGLRRVPEFSFIQDDTAMKAQRLEQALREHREELGLPEPAAVNPEPEPEAAPDDEEWDDEDWDDEDDAWDEDEDDEDDEDWDDDDEEDDDA